MSLPNQKLSGTVLGMDMTLNEWAEIMGTWSQEYRTKKERTPEFMFAHLHEEVSESWKEWREGRVKQHTDYVTKHDVTLEKPEGLPAELADVILIVVAIADKFDIDLDAAVQEKMDYLIARLAAKRAKKGKNK